MLQAAESLIPILVLVGLGSALFAGRLFGSESRRTVDRFVFWIALPSLFIHRLSETDFQALEVVDMVVVMAITSVATSLLAAVFAVVMRLSRDEIGVFVQVGFRGNMAFVGLPLIIFAMDRFVDSAELVSAALIVLAATALLNNVISVVALITAQRGLSWSMIPGLILEVIKNPLIIAAAVGSLLGWLGWALPAVVDRPFELLGQTAIALALVSLGAALVELDMGERIGLSTIAGLFKVSVVPLVAYGLCVAFGLPAKQVLIVMIFAACPAATVSYILTTQLGGDDALAAGSIVISTLLSFVSLAVVLSVFA